MRHLSLYILAPLMFFLYAGCKKKENTTIVKVDEENNDQIYGMISAFCTTDNNDSLLLSSFELSMNFNLSPVSPLTTKPSVYDITASPFNLQYLQGGWLNGSITDTSVSVAKRFSFAFTSPELGSFSFTEYDTVVPYYTWSDKDTFLISRKNLNIFTLTNYPSIFDLSFNIIQYNNSSQITKNLIAGVNSIKVYPNELLVLNSNETIQIQMIFSKFKVIRVDGKNYDYYRRFYRNYLAKLID